MRRRVVAHGHRGALQRFLYPDAFHLQTLGLINRGAVAFSEQETMLENNVVQQRREFERTERTVAVAVGILCATSACEEFFFFFLKKKDNDPNKIGGKKQKD